MGRAKTAWCRESFARNALLQAFDELGGHDDDVIFISDADEIGSRDRLERCSPESAALLCGKRLSQQLWQAAPCMATVCKRFLAHVKLEWGH
mgnify:CR=1 FL=1